MSAPIVKPALLRNQLLDELRRQIISGELAPGERLVELTLARTMGVSQGPVREALQRLAIEGLIVQREHRGSVVADLSLSEMREIFEVRAVIEGHAVAQLHHQLTKPQIAVLKEVLLDMFQAAQEHDLSALIDADLRFHRSVIEFSGHTLLLRLWEVADLHVRRFIYATHPKYFRNYLEIAQTHQPLIDALEAQDTPQAVQAFHDHLRVIWKRIDNDFPSVVTP